AQLARREICALAAVGLGMHGLLAARLAVLLLRRHGFRRPILRPGADLSRGRQAIVRVGTIGSRAYALVDVLDMAVLLLERLHGGLLAGRPHRRRRQRRTKKMPGRSG